MLYFVFLVLTIASITSYFFLHEKKKSSILLLILSSIFFISLIIHTNNPYRTPFLYEKVTGYVEDKYLAVDSRYDTRYLVLLRVKSFETNEEVTHKIEVQKTVYEKVEKNKIQHLFIRPSALLVLSYIICGGLQIAGGAYVLANLD